MNDCKKKILHEILAKYACNVFHHACASFMTWFITNAKKKKITNTKK